MTDLSDEVAAGKVLDFDKAVPMCSDEGWRDRISTGTRKDGEEYVKGEEANVITILRHDPRWQDVLCFNEFTVDIEYTRRPPWHPDDCPDGFEDQPFDGRVFEEEDLTRFVAWFQREEGCKVGVSAMSGAIAVVAKAQSYHPVRSYLQDLRWDGVKRVDTWLSTYAGVEDSEYSRLVGRWWVISAVARIFKPGAKVDHVLVLEGGQGLGKSTMLEALCAREEWFSDTPLDIGHKDAFQDLQGQWIHEFGELDGVVGRKEVTSLKAYLTSRFDRFRAAYARVTSRVARQVCFCASANRGDYLRDPTGNRRFLPVRCTRCDVEGMRRDRDQLWAEAVALYDAGERWYPKTKRERQLCEEQQAERMQDDDREGKIEAWLNTRKPGPVTVLGALEEALGVKEGERQNKKLQNDVADMLRRLGYERGDRITHDGVRIRPYIKVSEVQP